MAKSILSQSGVYCIRNKINGKIYIGSTTKFSMRFATHRYKLPRPIKTNSRLQESWLEHGADAFEFKVLLVCNKENLRYYEQRAIDTYNSSVDGFNISKYSSTNVGIKATEETKAKMSASHMGNTVMVGRKLSEVTKAKISASLLGNKRNFGLKASDESKRKMSLASKGKPKSEKAKENMRKALILRHQKAMEQRNADNQKRNSNVVIR